jgi:hypothetical protein
MSISKGDTLLFFDTGTIASVIDGDSTDGWDALIEEHGTLVHLSDDDALAIQASFISDPAGSPPSGSVVMALSIRSTVLWIVDGYATVPPAVQPAPTRGAPAATPVFAILTSLADPAQSAYVASNLVFAA